MDSGSDHSGGDLKIAPADAVARITRDTYLHGIG